VALAAKALAVMAALVVLAAMGATAV